MKKEFVHDTLGVITFEENGFSGIRTVTVNGIPLARESNEKFIFVGDNSIEPIIVKGNEVTGMTLEVKGQTFVISPKTEWYEYILFALPFIINIIWGNSVDLCMIIPVIGGAIGGAITVLLGYLGLSVMKKFENPLTKIGIGVLFNILAFGLTVVGAYIYLYIALGA